MGEVFVVHFNVITQNLCGNRRMVHLGKTYSEDLWNVELEW